MSFAVGLLDGLALAATIASDRDGAAAAQALVPELGAALADRLARLRALEPRARERALAALAASIVPRVDPHASLPPRAAAILAPDVDRAVGTAWLAAAPLPRVGFRATRALRATLRRLARAPDAARTRLELAELGLEEAPS